MNNRLPEVKDPATARSVVNIVLSEIPQTEKIFTQINQVLLDQEEVIRVATKQIVFYRNIGVEAVPILDHIMSTGCGATYDSVHDRAEDSDIDGDYIELLLKYGFIYSMNDMLHCTGYGVQVLNADKKLSQIGEPE